MKTIQLGAFPASQVVMGCMRIAGRSVEQADRLVRTALDCGVSLFDHADIYGAGESETLFGQVLQQDPSLRDRMLIQDKCGIRGGFYDLSCDHILHSVEASLQRLHTDYLDLLLFHRPDALAEPEEVARVLETLKHQGKVRQFGVSNMNPAQIRLLEAWTGETFAADQMQLSLLHAGLVTSGFNVNVDNDEGTMRDGGVLPFCQRRGMALQAWSPLQYGMFQGCFLGDPQFPQVNEALETLAARHQATPAAIALAWILRIPGRMQVITGTADPEHLRQACQAAEITLSRQEWYRLYTACGYTLP